jgi:endo-1,4-beta-xylanase
VLSNSHFSNCQLSISVAMRTSLFFAALLAAVSQAAPPTPHGHGKHIDLDALARRNGKHWFGSAADIPGTAETTDAAYLKVLKDNFGEITPANAMKVCPIERIPHTIEQCLD